MNDNDAAYAAVRSALRDPAEKDKKCRLLNAGHEFAKFISDCPDAAVRAVRLIHKKLQTPQEQEDGISNGRNRKGFGRHDAWGGKKIATSKILGTKEGERAKEMALKYSSQIFELLTKKELKSVFNGSPPVTWNKDSDEDEDDEEDEELSDREDFIVPDDDGNESNDDDYKSSDVEDLTDSGDEVRF